MAAKVFSTSLVRCSPFLLLGDTLHLLFSRSSPHDLGMWPKQFMSLGNLQLRKRFSFTTDTCLWDDCFLYIRPKKKKLRIDRGA